jgi:hypothetical protein
MKFKKNIFRRSISNKLRKQNYSYASDSYAYIINNTNGAPKEEQEQSDNIREQIKFDETVK